MQYNHADIKVEECNALVAYCDVTGFTTWMKRAAVSRSDVKLFIQKMKFTFRRFRVETGYCSIPIGDGIIALIVEYKQKPDDTLRLIKSVLDLQRRMLVLIRDETPHPRPGGFRVRITAGAVLKTEEPAIPGQNVRTFDVLGDPMNLGSRLLEVRRELPAVIHLSALSLLTAAELTELVVAPIELQSARPPRGVDYEDLTELSTLALRTDAA